MSTAVAEKNLTSEMPISRKRGRDLTVLEDGRRPRVVIVGGGFGGLQAVQALGGSEVDAVVLNRNNYHGFWPLLYQVATAGLESSSIAYPLRTAVRRFKNVAFELANVTGVDFAAKKVQTESGTTYPYDYLVLAAGSDTNYFGNNALAETTYVLKDVQDAEEIRNGILTAFEKAVVETDPQRRLALLTFVIVGGGPTGVELAGAISELIRFVLTKDYPMIDMRLARVVVVEAMGSILLAFPEKLQQAAAARLRKMGVKILLNCPVEKVEDDHVYFKDGTRLGSNMVIWTAGIRASSLTDALGLPLGRGFRVKVEPTLNLPDWPEVYSVGDMSYLEGYKENTAYPQVAQVAMQQGKTAAENILAAVRGEDSKPFRYADKGNLATIGRRAAVMDAFGFQIEGFVAWLGWLVVHIYYLIGARNRLVTLLNWGYYYFTHERGVRMINQPEREDQAPAR